MHHLSLHITSDLRVVGRFFAEFHEVELKFLRDEDLLIGMERLDLGLELDLGLPRAGLLGAGMIRPLSRLGVLTNARGTKQTPWSPPEQVQSRLEQSFRQWRDGARVRTCWSESREGCRVPFNLPSD